jgi:hypothetical protein
MARGRLRLGTHPTVLEALSFKKKGDRSLRHLWKLPTTNLTRADRDALTEGENGIAARRSRSRPCARSWQSAEPGRRDQEAGPRVRAAKYDGIRVRFTRTDQGRVFAEP